MGLSGNEETTVNGGEVSYCRPDSGQMAHRLAELMSKSNSPSNSKQSSGSLVKFP
ncbi:hypothetical protein JCGZ_25709 [Jatropha curcas]|uniref:Uncharacterized protein n=1 Tax=Jatropha curcas TaxID=180498 RepID=A0A067JPL0_JATCU|nr:hypothetical protein JCGZ_25709 [Jatropha curcas]